VGEGGGGGGGGRTFIHLSKNIKKKLAGLL